MDPVYPPLPLYAFFRSVDYDEKTNALILSKMTPYPAVIFKNGKFLPTFSSEKSALAYMAAANLQGKVVTCNAERMGSSD